MHAVGHDGHDGPGHTPLSGTQLRFADADVDAWATRVEALRPDATTRVGVAVHSVRAVPAEHLGAVAAADVVDAHGPSLPAGRMSGRAGRT